MGRKFTIFALFYFVFESKFHVQAPRGAYILRGDLTEGFLRYDFEGLIFGGAYFRNFTVLAFCSLCFLAPIRRCFFSYGRLFNSNPCLSDPVLFGIPY